jgi:sugar lactone lactonase YvrE
MVAVMWWFGVCGATEIVETLAGGGSVQGYQPDQTNLALGNSQGIAISAIGEIYFSDSGHNQVLKIEPTSGTVSIIAGNGTRAYNGDGLPAPEAGLNNPGGLAFDAMSNLFIADRGNFVVRRVDALSGVITTVAGNGLQTGQVVGSNPPAPLGDGGPAAMATFASLGDLVADSTGAITVCDLGNDCVRKFTVGGTIATIAGVPGTSGFSGDGTAGGALSARFNGPTGIAVDTSGAFYIADSGNRRVRKLTPDATVNTVVGVGSGGNAGFSGDGGPATSAQIGSLGGLRLDASNNLLISCVGANRIRKFVNDSTAIILTIAGNGSNGFSGDLGPATGASLSGPRDVALDSTGNIFIYDAGNARLRRVDAATGFIDTIAGTGLNGFIGDRGPFQDGVLASPSGMAFDAAGNLYIADTADNAVRCISPLGVLTTFAGDGSNNGLGDGGPAVLASVSRPSDVCVFGTTLYIADTGNNLIRAVNLSTKTITTYAAVNAPVALIADPTGMLYVAHDNQIDTVATNQTVTPFAGNNPMNTMANPNGDGLPATNARLRSPSGLALDAAGDLIVGDTGNNLVRMIAAPPGLIVSTIAGQGSPTPPSIGDGGPATAASLNSPMGVAVNATSILIADSGNQRIRSIDLPSGTISTVAGTGVPGFSGDGDVATNAQVNAPGLMIFNGANLVFADVNNNRVRQLVPAIDISPTLLSFSAKLNFSVDSKTGDLASNGDTVSIKAGLALPAGINPDNLELRVDVIDLHAATQLDMNGKIVKPAKVSTTPEPTVFAFTPETPPAGPLCNFSLGLKGVSVAGGKPTAFGFSCKGTLRNDIGRAGFTDVTTPSTPPTVPVRVNISLGTTVFTGLASTTYKATQGKSGSVTTVKAK